jgi:5'(3')-deoxyribonucleotidase
VTANEKIAFDLDNVLADSIGSFCEKASRLLGKKITNDDIKSHKIVGSIQLSPREIFRLQDEVWRDWKSIRPTEEGIPDTLSGLQRLGFAIWIVTSRPQRLMDSVGLWLLFNRVPYDRFYPLGPRVLKAVVSCDALVDDAPEQVGSFTQGGRVAFLYDRPWNQRQIAKEIIRIRSLVEVLQHYRAKLKQ